MTQMKRLVSTGAAIMLTIVAGAPAIADDTELLLVDPSQRGATPPNIMFILDTSGSMGDPVSTTEPYDSTRVYSNGSCDPDRFYWTTLPVEPSCSANTQFVDDAAFVCQDAELRMSGIGAYTGVMVQYRGDGDDDSSRWQSLEIGNASGLVECQRDSGEHGDGTSGAVYAQAGTDLDPFTSEAGAELAWGSGDAAQSYTIYDGNYLNWKENPVTTSLPKIDIMKAVTKNLMNAIENVNVGVMRFTGSDGGRILQDIGPIDTNRAAVLAKINALADGGNTPLAETLYESALYWRGLDADYGNLQVDESGNPVGDIDPQAFVGQSPGTYESPTMPVCTRNFNVLLTDGLPVEDADAQTKAPLLPNFSDLGRTACDGTEAEGRCLDDVAEYLSKVDISGTTEGEQVVTTHTIGFDVDLPILKTAAEVSGGDYYLAENVETLTTVLTRIVESIVDTGLSFVAPAVAVNSFNRTQNLNDLYISTFLPAGRVHWPGNLKKYRIVDGVITDDKDQAAVNTATGLFKDDARSIWTPVTVNDGPQVQLGGAANRLPASADRKLYTNFTSVADLTAGNNELTPSNAPAYTTADFGLTGATNEPSVENVIRWARGQDVLDDNNNGDTTDTRYVMGDPLHSQPAAVVYGGDAADPDVVVFTATNDGYFHAIDGSTGVELWSFIPKRLLQDLPQLMLNGNSTYKQYGIDGDIVPVVADLDNDGIINNNDFVYVIFGLRRGGTEFYALDVTDKDKPELLWTANYPEFGQSWSRPVVARVDLVHPDINDDKAVVIIGEGYDTVHDTAALPGNPDNVGAGISMLDLMTGERLWRAGRADADLTLPTLTRAIPSQVRAIDFNGDGFIDRMYAIDVGGQLFRFDVFGNEPPASLVTGGVIARFGGEGVASPGAVDTRRFYAAPDVSIFHDKVLNRRFLAIGVGSGYRAHPLNTGATDAYYSLRDPDLYAQLNQDAYNNYDIALDADMAEVSGQVNTVIGDDDRGWKFTLPAEQAVLSSSATFDNSVFFIGFEPDLDSAATCEVSPGKNTLYQVNVANGDPVANNLDTMLPSESDAARATALQQGGIAPTPSFLFPGAPDDCTGAACSPPPIGCVGVECFNPGFVNNPVRTLWTQDGIE